MKNIGLLAFFVLVISGCSTVWIKANATEQEFHQDKAKCLVMCGQASPRRGCSLAQSHIYDSCMMGKGWREKK